MSDDSSKSRGIVTAAAAAAVQVSLVVLVVVAVGWTLLKIAQWKQADATGGGVENRTIVLTTPFALIHGEAKMVPRGENSYIDDWKRLDDWIEWRFDVKTPGEHEVVVEYSCEAADSGSRYTVTVNEQSLSGRVAPTGQSWTADGVGRVEFEESGSYTLSIKPQSKPAAKVMRLRRILLRPLRRTARR